LKKQESPGFSRGEQVNAELTLDFCTGSHTALKWRTYTYPWAKLVRRLMRDWATQETEAEWALLTKEQQTAIKGSLGGWIAGRPLRGHRAAEPRHDLREGPVDGHAGVAHGGRLLPNFPLPQLNL